MKNLLALALFANFMYAGMVDAIAVIVNNQPITLFEIDEKMQTNKISKQEALRVLIDDILYKETLKQNNISADIFEVENYIEAMAKKENTGIIEFKAMLKQKYPNYEDFLEQIKKQISHEKFISKVARSQIKLATDEDLKIYYENNKNKFQVASSFEILQYSSKVRNDLVKLQSSPNSSIEGIDKNSFVLDQKNLNAQVKYLLNETKEGAFTPIFVANNKFVTILVNKKNGVEQLAFENVKDKIFDNVMRTREDIFLKEYFNKIRITAKIEIIR